MFEPTEVAWHNGRLVPREAAAPSIASHSLHLGIGVFDGMMAYRNGDHYYVHEMDPHLRRFQAGAGCMGLAIPYSIEELSAGIAGVLERSPPRDYYIRPIVYRGGPQINVTGSRHAPVDVAIFGVAVEPGSERALRCHVSRVERVSARAIPVAWKVCGAYANSYLARRAAEDAGFDEAIMLDPGGRVAEASAANIFFVAGRSLVTPSLTPEIFPGLTRARVLGLARELGIEAIERDVLPSELGHFDAAFLAATLMELKPLAGIDDVAYETADNDVYRRLWSAFRGITRGQRHAADASRA